MNIWPEHWTNEEVTRHALAEILENQRKQMAVLADVLAKVAKVSADFDAYVAAHQTTEAADLDQVDAALDALDAKIVPPPAPTA